MILLFIVVTFQKNTRMDSINYVLDGWDRLYVLQFFTTEGPFDKNQFFGCVKSLVFKTRVSKSGDEDGLSKEVDKTPIVFLKMSSNKMQCDLEVLSSPDTPASKKESCVAIANNGPKEFMDRIMPLYIDSLDEHLKFKGIVFRFANNIAHDSDERFVATEIEFLVSLFYPDLVNKK